MTVRQKLRNHIISELNKQDRLTLAQLYATCDDQRPYIKPEIASLLDIMPNVVRLEGGYYKLSDYIREDGSFTDDALGKKRYVKGQI
jgi:hypothetical protein